MNKYDLFPELVGVVIESSPQPSKAPYFIVAYWPKGPWWRVMPSDTTEYISSNGGLLDKDIARLRDRGWTHITIMRLPDTLWTKSPASVPADGSILDKPEDRLWHAADNTWWRRDGGRLVSADPPAGLQKQIESSELSTNLALQFLPYAQHSKGCISELVSWNEQKALTETGRPVCNCGLAELKKLITT